jgi:hypothetical protein
VTFISVSTESQETTNQFARQARIPWLTRSTAPKEILSALAAMSPEGNYGMPTLYVVRGDGTVTWNDGRARYQHQTAPQFIPALQAALETALRY